MLILTDNDVGGAVTAIRRILESDEWTEFTSILDLQFIEFEDVELPRDAPDLIVWQRCQEVGAILITGNRSSGAASLEQAIESYAGSDSLPILTNGLITLHIIDEILDIDLHAWTPVRDGDIGCRQYTPSSNSKTPESNKRVLSKRACLNVAFLTFSDACRGATRVC